MRKMKIKIKKEKKENSGKVKEKLGAN